MIATLITEVHPLARSGVSDRAGPYIASQHGDRAIRRQARADACAPRVETLDARVLGQGVEEWGSSLRGY